MTTLAVHDSCHLGANAACRDKRQHMDRRLARRYEADKDYGKQMNQRIFRCQGSRQELDGSMDQGIVVVGIVKTWCRRSEFHLQSHWLLHDRIQGSYTQHGWCYGEVNISMRTNKDSRSFGDSSGRFYKKSGDLSCTRIDPFIVAHPKA